MSKKCIKINAQLWNKLYNDDKEVYIEMSLRDFAKHFLGVDYNESEDLKSISLEIEEIEMKDLEELKEYGK